MAVDTATKRYTIMGVSLPFRGLTAVPSGVSSFGSRMSRAYYYSGISPNPPGGMTQASAMWTTEFQKADWQTIPMRLDWTPDGHKADWVILPSQTP